MALAALGFLTARSTIRPVCGGSSGGRGRDGCRGRDPGGQSGLHRHDFARAEPVEGAAPLPADCWLDLLQPPSRTMEARAVSVSLRVMIYLRFLLCVQQIDR